MKYTGMITIHRNKLFLRNTKILLQTVFKSMATFKSRMENYVAETCQQHDCQEDKTFSSKSIVNKKILLDSLPLISHSTAKTIISNHKNLNQADIVKIIFHLGEMKKSPESKILLNFCIKSIEKYINNLTLMDTCILASTCFKTDVQISEIIKNHFQSVVDSNKFEIIRDTMLLVCFVKICRKYSIFNYDFINTLVLEYNLWLVNFTVLAHIMALLADARYKNEIISNILVQRGLIVMKKYSLDNNKKLRLKDIGKFIWACSILNIYIVPETIRNVIQPLLETIDYKIPANQSTLLDINLSFAIMGYHSILSIPYNYEEKIVHKSIDENNSNLLSKWLLLNWIRYIEVPSYKQDMHRYAFHNKNNQNLNHIMRRNSLKQLFSIIQTLSSDLKLQQPEYQCQIPPLHIVGIKLNLQSTSLFIEALDDSNCLYKSELPNGIMYLKLRLLEKMSLDVIVVNDNLITSQSNEMLYTWFKSQILQRMWTLKIANTKIDGVD